MKKGRKTLPHKKLTTTKHCTQQKCRQQIVSAGDLRKREQTTTPLPAQACRPAAE